MSMLRLQKPAPNFSGMAVVDGGFKKIDLSQYLGRYVVLFFYPMDFTFVCPTEIVAFSDSIKSFKKVNCEVIGASTDSIFSHLAWINTPRKDGGLGKLTIPLLSDKSGDISRKYGVYNEETGTAFRGLFIIDKKGFLRQITVNDLAVGRSVEETLRLIQAFNHCDEFGEVCPANWHPGDKTIIPETDAAKSYFQTVEQEFHKVIEASQTTFAEAGTLLIEDNKSDFTPAKQIFLDEFESESTSASSAKADGEVKKYSSIDDKFKGSKQ